MLFRTALKIIFHEKEKFLGAVAGVTLALFLVVLQSGFYLGYRRDITVILDAVDADLWIVPKGQVSFDGWDHIDDLPYWSLQANPQIEQCSRLVCGYAPWRIPGCGGKDTVQVIGVNFGSQPAFGLDIDHSDPAALVRPDGHILIARKDCHKLGVHSPETEGLEIAGRRAKVVGFVDDVHLFNTAGFVLTSLDNARAFLQMAPSHATYIVCKCDPTADVRKVRDELRRAYPDNDVLLTDELRSLTCNYWESNTGIGPVLLLSAVLAVFVGFLIVMSTFYISTVEKVPMFAALRAIGASTSEIVIILVFQIAAVFVAGCILAGIGLHAIVRALSDSTISVVVTPWLVIVGVGLMLACSTIGSLVSIRKLVTADPGEAFRT